MRHCFDVTHIEINICDSIIGTLLNISGMATDGVKNRLNLVEMGIREQLTPEQKWKIRIYLQRVILYLERRS